MPAVIPTEGLNRIAARIETDTIWVGVGTGTNAPLSTDTQLQTETNRMAATEVIRNGTLLQIRAVFTDANLPATVRELGVFLNGGAGANSGEIMVRALVTFTKAGVGGTFIVELTVAEG